MEIAVDPLLQSIIDNAWRARFARNMEGCRANVSALRQKMSFLRQEFTAPDLDPLFKHYHRSHVGDLICLWASVQRADGVIDEARATLEKLESSFYANGWPLPFQLCFQKGLGEFARSHFSAALDLFLAAKSAARNALEMAYAISNALFCLEALGMPYDQTKKELLANLTMLRSGPDTKGIQNQLAAFEWRTAFREGRMNPFKARKKKKEGLASQSDYYLLWVSALPFHVASASASALEREDFFISNPALYQKGYRLRTLQGLIHDDDLRRPKETEFADRVYLWTWRWLTGVESSSIPKIMALFRHVDLAELASRLTSEDYQLIRNSLLWLGLFDANSGSALHKITEAMRPVHAEDFRLFAFEREVISYLYAVRDHHEEEARDLLKIVEAHPLWKNPDLYWGDLVKGLSEQVKPGGPLKSLFAQIRQFNENDGDGRRGVLVDLTSFEITFDHGKKKIISPPLCYAIESIFRKNPLEFEELLRVCFGISQYDPLSHASKIFNLIARMKACLPEEIILTSKNGKLYAEGGWGRVHIVRPHPLASALQNQPEWRDLIRRRVGPNDDLDERWVKPAQILKKLSGQSTLKRHELEALTGKSRSTANRIIGRWLAQGVLKKTGRAKNTVYYFLSTQFSTHKKI